MDNELINYLSEFVTDQRKELFNETVDLRTRYITVVLENIYQPQNASAVLRTCDCFGIQNIHIIENENEYILNPDVTLGSNQWLNLEKHSSKQYNTADAINKLRNEGYRIVATTPHINDVTLENFNLGKGKVALLFGTELNGLSQDALEMADEFVKIPVFGFTESFNISVSAAIILHNLTNKLRNNGNIHWQLSKEEKETILLQWYKNSIKDAEGIINKYFNEKSNKA